MVVDRKICVVHNSGSCLIAALSPLFGVGRSRLWVFFPFVMSEGGQVVAVFVNTPARR